jgi:hypothetical protein
VSHGEALESHLQATLFAAFDNGTVRSYNMNDLLIGAAAAAAAAAAASPSAHPPPPRNISLGLPLIRQHDAQVHCSLNIYSHSLVLFV